MVLPEEKSEKSISATRYMAIRARTIRSLGVTEYVHEGKFFIGKWSSFLRIFYQNFCTYLLCRLAWIAQTPTHDHGAISAAGYRTNKTINSVAFSLQANYTD
jgi:hypothetical protein